jgi:archaeal flagellar protein FlaJ
MVRVPLMVIPLQFCLKVKRLYWLGNILTKFVPSLDHDLKEADFEIKKEAYGVATFINGFFYGLIFSGLFAWLAVEQQKTLPEVVKLSLLIGFGLFLLFSMVLLRYPKILAGKKGELVDQVLVFALKDVWLQISSGVSLYVALTQVADAKYGVVSKEFKIVVQDINRGLNMQDSLNRMAERSKSLYLRRTLWQLVNTLKAGASVKGALNTIIRELTASQERKIKDYARELNLWTLLYMLFAVAIPTIGATMLVILSGFAGFKITQVSFVSFIVITMFFQIVLIGFIKTRRPMVQF